MGRLIVGFVFVFMHFPVGYASWLFYTLAACGLFIAYEVSGDNVKWSIGLHMFNNILVLL
jgi:membrane protease YdiL (CAAX protease family)